MFFREARGAKNCYAWSNEMQYAKAAQHFPGYADDLPQLMCTRVRSLQEDPFAMSRATVCWKHDAKLVDSRIHSFNPRGAANSRSLP